MAQQETERDRLKESDVTQVDADIMAAISDMPLAPARQHEERDLGRYSVLS